MDNKTKILLKKVWHFIWEDNSIWSWIVNIIIAFLLIKFIVYPVLGILLSTSHPIVAVVSSSMEHDGNFDTWWQSEARCNGAYCTQETYYAMFGISKEEFLDYGFKNGFNTGDIMILYGTKPKNIKEGDVLVFKSNRPDPIIHRVIKVTETDGVYHYQTKGDHNPYSYQFESNINENFLVGEAKIRIPYLGWVKMAFVKLIELVR